MSVAAAGVDTWSVAWYLREGSSAVGAMEHLATDRAARARLLPESVAGHRVGWFPGSRMVFAEGRPGGDLGLSDPGDLPGVLKVLRDSIRDRGVALPEYDYRPAYGPGSQRPDDAVFRDRKGRPVPLAPRVRSAPPKFRRSLGDTGFAGVRRLDSTVDLHFEGSGEGLAVLSGVAAVPMARIAKKVQREVGGRRVETVWLLGSSGRAVLGRWYDKGLESGSHARGVRIRPEDQRRFAKGARVPVDVVADTSYVLDSFVRRFEPLWQASKGVLVGALNDLAERVVELVEDGDMTPGEAKGALAHLVLDAGGQDRLQSRRTWYRDRSVCRKHGLVLADADSDRVSVDLGEVMEEAFDADVWGEG